MPETFATVQPLLHGNLSVPAPQRTCVIQCIMNELFFCLFASSGCFVYMLTLYDVCLYYDVCLSTPEGKFSGQRSAYGCRAALHGGAVFHSRACHLQNFLLVPPIMFVCHSRHACPLQIIRLLLPSHPRLLYTTSPAAFFTLTAALALRGQCIHRAAAGWDKNRVYFPPFKHLSAFQLKGDRRTKEDCQIERYGARCRRRGLRRPGGDQQTESVHGWSISVASTFATADIKLSQEQVWRGKGLIRVCGSISGFYWTCVYVFETRI